MTLSLSPELEERVESEIAMGDFQTSDQLIQKAVLEFLDARRGRRRIQAINRIADAVDRAGLYYSSYVPTEDDSERLSE